MSNVVKKYRTDKDGFILGEHVIVRDSFDRTYIGTFEGYARQRRRSGNGWFMWYLIKDKRGIEMPRFLRDISKITPQPNEERK